MKTNTQKPAPPGTIRQEEAARLIGCSVQTLKNRMKSGLLRYVQPFGRGMRFPIEEEVRAEIEPVASVNAIVAKIVEQRKRAKQSKAILIAEGVLPDKNGNYIKKGKKNNG